MENPPELVRLYNLARGAFEQKQYDRAISLAERYLEQVPEDTWALGMIHGALLKKQKRARSEAARARLQQRIDELQQRIRAKGEDSEIWLEQWNRAYALNGQAWSQYEAATSEAELEGALRTVDEALAFTPYQFGYQDTRVRILLKLGREDEAFTVVRWVLALMPQQMDFQEFTSDARYRRWLEAQGKARPRLPRGPATLDEVIPEPGAPLLDTGGRLTRAQREHLLACRVGKDEWHRARNTALLALLEDCPLGLEELAAKTWPQTNLSQGTIATDARGTVKLGGSAVQALRHAMLIDTCHKQFIKNHKNKLLMFKTWGFAPLTPERSRALLAEIGARLGVPGLAAERFRRSWFRRFGGGLLGQLADSGRWTRVEEQGADTDGLAEVISWPSRYDSWYVLYTYEHDGAEFGFVFETDYDEIHRGYSGGPATWYDPLTGGTHLAIRYCARDPRRHRVTDPRFDRINGRARFVGRARHEVEDLDDLEW